MRDNRFPTTAVSLAGKGLAMGLAALVVSGCTTSRGGPIPYEVADFGTPDVPEPVALEDQRIEPLDTVALSVFQAPDLSGTFEVGADGMVSLPLIGSVKAAGHTAQSLQADVQQRLRKYVKNPAVSISVKSVVRRGVTVDGAVRQPGMYPVSGPVSLIQAIALARGLEPTANESRVAVFRRVGGRRMAAAFDLRQIRRGEAEDPEIHTGDIIVVAGSKNRELFRDVLTTIPVLGIFRPY